MHSQDILIICDEEIAKLSRLEEAESRRSGGAERRGGINVAVSSDVSAVFKGKTVSVVYGCVCACLHACVHVRIMFHFTVRSAHTVGGADQWEDQL